MSQTTEMEKRIEEPQTWPDLAISLYDRLTGRHAEITYEFENFELHVPSSATGNASQAPWKMNGTLKIRTREVK
jgi:hypothetical protein